MTPDVHRQIGHVVGSIVAEQCFTGRAAEMIDEVDEIAALRLFVEERQVNFVDPFWKSRISPKHPVQNRWQR